MNGVLALRVFFVAGAVVDALAVVAPLSPAISRMMLGVDVPGTSALLYAMRTGASLMLGWTCLLVWAALRPIERRTIALLTVVPVLVGLAATEVLAVREGFVSITNVAPLLGMQALLGLLGITAWRASHRSPSWLRDLNRST